MDLNTAKRHELDGWTSRFFGINVTAESADVFELQVLGIAIVVFVIGRVLMSISGEATARQPA